MMVSIRFKFMGFTYSIIFAAVSGLLADWLNLPTTLAADENFHFLSRKEGQADLEAGRFKLHAEGGPVAGLSWLLHIPLPSFRLLTVPGYIAISTL